jgi:hypothetical protein
MISYVGTPRMDAEALKFEQQKDQANLKGLGVEHRLNVIQKAGFNTWLAEAEASDPYDLDRIRRQSSEY